MDRRGLARWRLRNSALAGSRSFSSVEAVIGWFGAVQAQDYGPAAWAIGQRVPGLKEADVDDALAAGTILRTHLLRPTWHFVLPDDIGWLLRLTSPRVHAFNAYHYRRLGLGDALLQTCDGLIADALRNGEHLTRKEIATLLRTAGVTAEGQRLGYIVMHAELEGVICSGGRRGKQHTYALLSDQAPAPRRLSRDEAIDELVVRYFTSHGPATIKDLSWWSSLPQADLLAGVERVKDHLVSVVVDDLTFWAAPAAAERPDPTPVVQLIQPLDEYVIGYTQTKPLLDIDGILDDRMADALYSGIILLEGQIAGWWKRTLKAREVVVEVGLYRQFTDSQVRALHDAAESYGAFVGRDVVVLGL